LNYINYLVTSKFAKGTEGHLNADDLLGAIDAHDGGEAYYNHFDVLESGLGTDEGKPTFKGASGVCRPAFNLVGFDFDSADSPEKSLHDVQAFLNYFRFEHFYVAYSGSKGFHISVPFEYFDLPADENLPKTLRNLAHELRVHFPTLDTSVYNIGRKFRAVNSQHGKTGLYKTIISRVGINTRSMDAITDYCSTRRTLNYEVKAYDVKPNEALVRLLEDVKATASYDKAKAGTALAPTKLEAFDDKTCIRRLFEAEIDEGERNTTCLILINDLYKSGKSKDHCIERMTPWIDRVMPEHRKTECFEMIDDIYNGDRFYNHGCLEPIKAKYCSAKCGIYTKVSPAKRPTPVDAPKSAFKELQTVNAKPATIFIGEWLKNNMAVVTLSGNWFLNNNMTHPTPRSVIEDRIFNASDLMNRKEYRVVPQNRIIAYLNEWEESERRRRLNDLARHIDYTEANDLVDKFLTAVVGRAPSTLEVNVFKHWLWLVKRKVNRLNVEREMMIVIAGITNTGKTYAVTKVFKPLKEVVDTMMLDTLTDDKETARLTLSAIIFFDEMAVTKKVNVEALKNKITAKWLNYRPLYKNGRTQDRNFATFIGTSNSRVSDIIKDPTSARRYFEYWVDSKCDWDAINKIDYLEMWRGIDENQETPYIQDHIAELEVAQEDIRSRDSVEEWLELDELRPEGTQTHDFVKPREAYNDYVAFMRVQQRERYAVGIKRFFNRMTELELNGKDYDHGRHYKIKASRKDDFDPSR